MARSLGPRHVRKQVRSLFSGSSSVSVPGGYPKLSQVAARRSRAAGPRQPRDRAGFVLAAAGLTRGLNRNHNRVLKDIFKGAATAAPSPLTGGSKCSRSPTPCASRTLAWSALTISKHSTQQGSADSIRRT